MLWSGRYAKAIAELNDAIAYMQAAAHDFGGRRADAVQTSQAAITQLQLALEFRETKDANRKQNKQQIGWPSGQFTDPQLFRCRFRCRGN